MSKIIIWIMIVMVNLGWTEAGYDYEIKKGNGEYFEEYVEEFTEDLIEATNGQVQIQREGNRVKFYFTSDMVEDCRMEGFAAVIIVVDGDAHTYDIYEVGQLDGETASGWEHGTFEDDFGWMTKSFEIGHMK